MEERKEKAKTRVETGKGEVETHCRSRVGGMLSSVG